MSTEKDQHRPEIAAAIVSRVTKKTSLLLGLAAAGALLWGLVRPAGNRPWFPAVSILFGGALGLVNFRWLARVVERLYLRKGATTAGSITAAEIVNILKLAAIFIVLFVVIKWGLVHVLGLIVGLSLCFLAILWEGLVVMAGKE